MQIIWAAGRPGADINNLFHTGRGTRGSFPGDDDDDDDDEDTGDKSYQKRETIISVCTRRSSMIMVQLLISMLRFTLTKRNI